MKRDWDVRSDGSSPETIEISPLIAKVLGWISPNHDATETQTKTTLDLRHGRRGFVEIDHADAGEPVGVWPAIFRDMVVVCFQTGRAENRVSNPED